MVNQHAVEMLIGHDVTLRFDDGDSISGYLEDCDRAVDLPESEDFEVAAYVVATDGPHKGIHFRVPISDIRSISVAH